MNRFLKAFYAGMQDYGLLYPRNYVSFKEYRYYMRGRRFALMVADLLPTRGKRYE